MRKVLLSGYAKLPEKTTAQKLYSSVVMVVTVELPSGKILDVDCTTATDLARSFIREVLVGQSLAHGPDPLIQTLNRSYYGHLKKALQTCIRNICTQYLEVASASSETGIL